MKRLEYLKNVTTLSLDSSKCTGCRMCLHVCPHEVFVIENRLCAIAHRDACMECGACSRNCRSGALSVKVGVGCAAAVINSVIKGAGACDCDCECC